MMRDSMDYLGSFDADERYLMNARPRGTWNQRTRLEKLLLIFLGLLCVALVGFIIGVAVLDSKVNQLQSDIGALKSGSKTTTAPPSTFPSTHLTTTIEASSEGHEQSTSNELTTNGQTTNREEETTSFQTSAQTSETISTQSSTTLESSSTSEEGTTGTSVTTTEEITTSPSEFYQLQVSE